MRHLALDLLLVYTTFQSVRASATQFTASMTCMLTRLVTCSQRIVWLHYQASSTFRVTRLVSRAHLSNECAARSVKRLEAVLDQLNTWGKERLWP